MINWFRRMALLFPPVRRRRRESLDDEIASYLEMSEAAARDSGISVEEAAYAARRDLGNITLTREEARSEWVPPKLEHFVQDIGYLLRTLRREPGFALVAVGSLALGIGAANVIFSLVDGILLKPLAYARPGELVYLQEFVPPLAHVYPSLPVNYQQFRYWQQHSKTFRGMAALSSSSGTLTGAGEPVELNAVETTAGLFDVLGTKMAMGRGFFPAEEKPGHSAVVVISDGLWRSRFHQDPNIVGRRIAYGGAPVTVVGVLPADFTFPKGSDLGKLARLGKRIEIFQPIQRINEDWDGDYDYLVFGRLRNGMALPPGLAELGVLTRQLAREYQVKSGPRPIGKPLQEAIGSSVSGSLWVLLASVLILLLIVCVNLTNLMLARAHARSGEFSIRTALGAGQGRLMQQILTEALVLASVGGMFGIAVAATAIRLLKAQRILDLPRLSEVQIDRGVLLFSLGLILLCACLSGLSPALRAIRCDLQTAMRQSGAAVTSGRKALRSRQILVGSEVALSTVLVFLAALLISSLIHLLHVDKGFEEQRAVAIDVDLPDTRYPDKASRLRFYERILAEVKAVPGIRSAAVVQGLPLTGESMVNGIEPEGSKGDWFDAKTKTPVLLNVRFVSPDYFETLGISLIAGRFLQAQDRERKVAVVSERLAKKVWGGEDALGKKFKTGSQVGEVQVVGIVHDTYNGRLDEQPTLIAYVPIWIRPPGGASIVFRTQGASDSLIRPVQRAVWAIDASLPVSEVRKLTEIVSAATAQRRFQMHLATAFGVGALFLTLIGIYGVVAYNVEQRKSEISLRLALGAKHWQLMQLIMQYGLAPVLAGLGSGLVCALIAAKFLRAMVFGVTPGDPLILAGVSCLLIVAAVLACLIPATRVIHMEPAALLRQQ